MIIKKADRFRKSTRLPLRGFEAIVAITERFAHCQLKIFLYLLCGALWPSIPSAFERLANVRSLRAKFPLIPGHEVIGIVVAVGPGEKKWKEGDRVGGPWHGGHDGTCKSCNRGLFQLCDNELINGVSRNGGCMSQALQFVL